MARGLFEEAYLSLPPWDIGRPQGEIIRLAEKGEIRGAVLDAGCGTGENALFLANQGYEVTGIDAVEAASSILVPGGTFRMLCFSEKESGDWGPRRVTQREIREAFDRGWKVDSIQKARFETNLGPEGCRAWLSSINGNERRRKTHGSYRGVQRWGVRHCDHSTGARAKDPAQGEEAMKLQVLLILSVFMVGVSAYAAEEPAANVAEAAKVSVKKAEVSAKKAAEEAKEATQKAAEAAKLAMEKAEKAVSEASHKTAEAAKQSARKADEAAKRAARKTAEASKKATAETKEAAQKAEEAAIKAAVATKEAMRKAEEAAKKAAMSGKEAAKKAAEATRDAALEAAEATKEAADKALEAIK